MGRPAQACDDKGELVWSVEFDIYGKIRECRLTISRFILFRQLGQYEDVETELNYDQFRYYNSETGLYISQDLIGLVGITQIFINWIEKVWKLYIIMEKRLY
ncbi:hypothetical protein JMI89_08340 [Frischella sp. Ac48]|nr:hypothetical protein [Frischella sp. Ac48]